MSRMKAEEERVRVEERALDVFAVFELIFREDVRFKIIRTLSNREAANLRQIARCVGISHKNLSKYLEKLMQKGVVEAYSVGVRMRIYRLASKYDFLKDFLNFK